MASSRRSSTDLEIIMTMDGLLFDPTEYIDTNIAADVLKDLTCRQCANSFRRCTLAKPGWFCKVRFSKKTLHGELRIKTNQPACILFTKKNDTK